MSKAEGRVTREMRALQMRNMPEARRNAAIQAGVDDGTIIDLRTTESRGIYRRWLAEARGVHIQ